MTDPSRKSKNRSDSNSETPPDPGDEQDGDVVDQPSLLPGETIFVDSCLGKSVYTALCSQGLKVVHHDEVFAQGTLDTEWLPIVGAYGWIVFTKDKALKWNAPEMAAVLAARVRLFTLNRGKYNAEKMIEIYVEHLERIDKFVQNHQGPYIVSLSPSALTVVFPRP